MTGPSAAELQQPAQPAEPVDTEAAEVETEAQPAVELAVWRPSLLERIKEAWHSRHLLGVLGARTFFPSYQGLFLGRAWLVLMPLMMVGGPALLFGGVFGTRAPNGVPYILFLLFGMQGWVTFQRTLIIETKASRMYRRFTKSLKLPLLLIPIAALGRGLMMLIVMWIFIGVALIFYGITRGQVYLQAPPRLFVGIAGVLLCFGFAFAFGLFFAVIYPRAQDIRMLVRQLLRLWMYITPVFYPLSILSSPWNTIAELNPLTSVLGMIQYGFVNAGNLTTFGVCWTLGFFVVLLFSGLWFYNRFATQWIGLESLAPGAQEDEDDEVML